MTPTAANDIEEHLPLSDVVFHILLALVENSHHGYGILLDVEARTDGALRLGTGTLYSAIKRLRKRGLIADTEPPADEVDPRRRYYRLTELGRQVVRAEALRLENLVSAAREKRVLPVR